MPKPVISNYASDNLNTRALAVLRIGVGIFFLIFGQYKVFGTQFILTAAFSSGSTASSNKAAPIPSWHPSSEASSYRTSHPSPSWSPTASSLSD
jgi:hypothetical protein